jgi:DNA invertase Pin-like site-specific DNA recombinase
MITPNRKRKRKAGSTKIAIGYLRVSTSDQHLGPEAQRQQIEAWAKRQGVKLAAVYEDRGVSGATPIDERPGLMSALTAIEEHGAGVLVAAKRDRFARDMAVALVLEWATKNAGAQLVSVDHGVDDGADEVALLIRKTLDDMLAQVERLRASQRTKAALAVKRSRGERTGYVPLGHKLGADGVHLEVDEVEARALERILALRASGLTIRAIADRLNAEGVPARGERWHKTSVGVIVARHAA